jgi:hypothetical protein
VIHLGQSNVDERFVGIVFCLFGSAAEDWGMVGLSNSHPKRIVTPTNCGRAGR